MAIAALGAALAAPLRAEPYLAVAQGYKCNACHVNPTGGALRNAFGIAFARNTLPAWRLPDGAPAWTGGIGDYLRLGADLRETWSRTEVPNRPSQQGWELDPLRLYADVTVLPGRLAVYVDEQLEPGSPQTQEAYVRASTPDGQWTAKAGKFYLPFGWRLPDSTSFVRSVSGIGMATPDTGLELGLELPQWSAQLAWTNGSGNAGSGHQVTAQAVWVQPVGRLGLAASFTKSDVGDRRVLGVFGGLRTGPLAWLGELDQVRDDGYPEGRRTLLAALGEVNWTWRAGHNVKLTGELFDPDRRVDEDHKARWSLVYEFTPIPFVQLRLGTRRWDGIPQNDFDNRRLWFFEVHGFL